MLTKQGRNVKSWKRRLFLVQPSVLYYFSSKNDMSAKGYMLLQDVVKVEDVAGQKPNTIAVVSPTRTLLMYADTPHDAAAWISVLNTMVTLQKYRSSYAETAGAWGSAEPFLKNLLDHARKVLLHLMHSLNFIARYSNTLYNYLDCKSVFLIRVMTKLNDLICEKKSQQ